MPHKKLVEKLRLLGLQDIVVNWIESYLSNRKQVVEINKNVSNFLPVTSGVPQGSVLGPLLFLIYINDIANEIAAPVQVRLFADDCLIYSPVSTVEDQWRLNNALQEVKHWSDKWDMKINYEKSLFANITNKKKKLLFNYCF